MLFPPIKVVLLVSAAISFRAGLRPPNPPPSKRDAVERKEAFGRVVRVLSSAAQITVVIWLLSECILLALLQYPEHQFAKIIPVICPATITPERMLRLFSLSRHLVTGVLVMLLSGALRVWCYSTLGDLFTFEVAIKRDHALVTSGPYAYVRHPSYTGIFFLLMGTVVTCFTPGSYVSECQLLLTSYRWWVYLWWGLIVYTVVSLWRRAELEDRNLSRAFPGEWNEYRQVVPYKFVPLVW